MRILAVADEEARYYYDYYAPGKLDEFDLIIACGDLHRAYLEFLVTMAHCPVLYVKGNHDDSYETAPPEGCVCIEDHVYVHEGVRIVGLGGSFRYNRDGINMYTERQMRHRIHKLALSLLWHKGCDILVTHAPARHINDMDGLPHRGFECFVNFLAKYKPKYFIHGHIHKNYGVKVPQVTQHGDTTIINAFEYYKFDY